MNDHLLDGVRLSAPNDAAVGALALEPRDENLKRLAAPLVLPLELHRRMTQQRSKIVFVFENGSNVLNGGAVVKFIEPAIGFIVLDRRPISIERFERERFKIRRDLVADRVEQFFEVVVELLAGVEKNLCLVLVARSDLRRRVGATLGVLGQDDRTDERIAER